MITDSLDSIVAEERMQARINESPELIALQAAVRATGAALASVRSLKAQVERAEADAAKFANEAHRALQRALSR